MGDGATPNVKSGTSPVDITPLPAPLTEDQKQVLTEDHKSPAPSAAPPDDAQLKKITAEVSSMGVKLPGDMVDEKGNIKPEKLSAAKDFIKAEADKRRGTDVGAAARLLKRAISLDPKDEKLRLETAKVWLEWNGQTKDVNVRKVQLEEAFGFIGDIDTQQGKNPEFAKVKYDLAQKLVALNVGHLSDKDASKWLGIAVENATTEQVQQILKDLKEYPHPELLDEMQDPYLFIAAHLIKGSRFDEARAMYTLAVNEATDPKQKETYLRFFHAFDGVDKPYSRSFDGKSNPVVQELYEALRKQGITDAALKGADGKAEHPADDKIWPGDVLRYINEHYDSKKVQGALKTSKLEIPPGLKKDIKEKGFSQAMADYHAAEAKKLARSDRPEDKQLCSTHLRIAVGLDGDNVERRLRFGQALMREGKFADAADAFEQVRRRQPMNTEVLLDLARAQLGAGEPKKALAALDQWDNGLGVSLRSPEKITEVDGLRRKAGSMHLADLLKVYDGLKGGGSRDERQRLLDEMSECPKATNMERFAVLKRQRDFFAAEVKRPGADSIDIRHAQEDLDKLDKRIETLRDDLKEVARVKSGEAPTLEQLDAAKTAAEISRSYGDLSDLLRYNDLVKSATPDVMDAKAKLDAYGEVYRALRAQGGRTSETDAIGRQIQELAQDYLSSSKAKDYLEQVVMNGSGPVLDLLSAEGLKKLETEVDAGNKALAEAGKKTDVKEKRGCLLEALKHFGALGDNAKAREIAGQLESTIPADMSRVDKLQIYGLMSGVLKDSRVTVEDGKNSTLTKEYQDKGSALAVEIIGRGNMGPPHGAERVKELMVAKAFCDSVGDIPNATTATLRLSGIQGELLADPMFTDPKLASDPAKAKERLETARLVVQIDLELMGGKLNTAAKIVQEISEGKRPESDRALVSDDMKRIADHIGIWQDQLALAKDLPVDERLAEGTKIAASLGRLKILTQGDKPLLKPEDISSVNGKFETTMSEIFADCMEQGPGASEEDKKMAADVVSDMKGRLKLDIEDGNMIWASQLDPKKLIQFAETAQNARKLMADAKARGPLDPTGTQRYLQAAALYAQIGCKDRVKEAMRPVEVFEAGLTTPSDKIGLDFSIAQIYTMAGMNKEANGILYRAAQMNTGAYPLDVQDLATLAQGMIHLNNGDTDKARAELEKLPDNKTAQELLRGISAGGRELRINQSMQIARSWLFSLEEKNMSPEKQALMEQGIDDVLHKAKTLMLDGKATDFRDALTKAAREAPAAVQGYIQSNLISTGNDSLPNDPQGKIMAAITVMADPNVSDKDAAEAAIKLSDGLILAGERYYGNAGQIAKFMVDNPYVGAEAKKIIDEKIPEWVKMGAIFSGLKGLACATPPGAFCMIFFAGSEAEANEAMVNSLISIGSFGIARGLAVGAEALWVAKMATVIESPVIMGVTKFGVRTVTEAAAFPVAGALLTTALTGKVDHWQPEHFKKEFLSMLVTFTLLHGAGIPLSKFTGRAERSVLEAQEALKVARQTSQGVEAAESALNRAMAFEKMAKGVGWVGNVAAFTGAEYVNESLGLKADEKGVPFWMKFLGCAVTDAQMKVGGKIIDGVTNGKLTRIETNTAKIMQVHSELPKFNAAVGVGETSAPVMKAIQGRIVADPKFDPAKFLTEAQGTMKILEPALKDLPKDKQDQVRQGLLLEIAEGKLDTKLAQTLAKRVKAGQSEIVPNESGSGYDFVPGKKSIDAKKKEDQRQADAQQKSAQKRVDDAKKKSDDQAAAALQQQQEKAFQGREKARVAEFDKGFGFREAKRKDGAVIGIEKYDTKTDAVVETKTPPTKEDLESFQGYQKKQAAKQELRSGFEKGQRILPDPKDKGKFQLVDVNGEKVRDASKEELGQYLQFKKDARAFQAAEKLRTEAVQKILGERVAGLETEFDNGTVVRMKMKKAPGGMAPDGIEKVARDGTVTQATTFELDAYKGWQTKKADAARKADAEGKLKAGFAEGQSVVLNADTGKYELVSKEGKTLRVATDAEQKLFSDFGVEKQKHDEFIAGRAKEMAPEFDKGTVVRMKMKKAPGGMAPDGIEKVDKDGKVLNDAATKDDLEAYQSWYAQKKEGLKSEVLKSVEPAPADKPADGDKTPVVPIPIKKVAGPDREMLRAADASHAFDLSFDAAMQAGKSPKAEDLSRIVQDSMDGIDALQPALDGLPKAKREAVKEGILQQLADGKMTKAQALELAEKIQKGEAELVPNAKAEYGFDVKTKEPAKPVDPDQTISEGGKGKKSAGADGPDTKRDGAMGKAGQPAPEDPVQTLGIQRSLEAKSKRAQWRQAVDQAIDHGSPADKAAAESVLDAAMKLDALNLEYLKAKGEARKAPEGSPERAAADKKVTDLQGEMKENLDLIQKWEDYPTERSRFTDKLTDSAFPFMQRSIQRQGFEKGFSEAPPEGTPILDVSFRQPEFGDDFNAGPGKTSGQYEVVLHVRNEADMRNLLGEVRLNHGQNKAQFVKDADGRVRSVEMTTPDGKVFSVRVEVATPENRAEIVDRGGIAGGTHEGIGYKDHNEDRQVVVSFANGRTVTLVIDGMGGTEGGEMAAKIAKTTFEKAVKEGKSVDTAIKLANDAVADYGKDLLPGLTQKLMDQGYDKDTAGLYAKRMLPGAVAMGTEISRNADGTYNARFRSVGDCEAAVIRFKSDGTVEILDAYGRTEDQIRASRSDPNANIVDQSLGGHAGPLKITSKDVKLQKGDIVLNGSDGFFENFGSHAEIAFLIKQSGATSPSEIRSVLMREVLIRQKLADTLEKSGQENMVLTADAYGQAYKAVTGEEPPAGWKGMYEGRVLDMMGNVGDAKDLGRVQVTYSGSEPFEFQGVPRDKMKTHFKKDNTTLMVQSVGDPVRPDTATPSRADLAKDQLVLAKELAGSFGLDQNPDFMKDLNALVLKDVSSAGRGLTEKGRTELIGQRMKEARALAERYGLEKNVPFVKLLSRLVVDNLREGEIRFGEAPAKSAESDPALQGFMEKQRGYGLRLVKSFEGKVEPGKRMKFAMDLGKILSADAAGLPTGGDAVLEGKFKDNRQATLEAFAKEYGLDGDAKFMKAAGMILIDSVMKDCPRVEAPPAKVDPAVRKAGTRLEADVYNNALRRGKNLEEAAQLAEQAKGHFDAAIKDGKTPNEAVAIANEKMDADLKQTVRPGAPAPKDPAADEKATVRPGKPKDPTPDQKDTVRPGKPKGPGDVTPSGVRVSDTMTPELQKEVDHLAEGNTPFTAAARDLKAGKITPKEYREAQKAVADKMVADNQAAFEDVMGFLKELGADPDLHLSKEFPAKGRMKAADDLAPKLVRRGWQDASPLTDIAATRIVVESNADVEAVIAKIQQKYTIREAYTKDGEIEADVMTPDEMKAKGIAEEEGVVFIDAKMDKDGIHRLVDGHPASGYRALHVVVEIDGKPVEIQIKTAAMHEWGEIEHKLVYKNKDLPPAVMDPIKQFRKDVADYLAKATHLEPGEKAPEMPKAPELPADAPNRAELQSGLDQMVDLMKKYSGPGGSVDLSGVNIPKAAKAPDVGGIARKAEYELDIFDHVYPPKGGQPEFTDVDITGEINLAAQRLGENGNQALRDKISADLKTLETAPRDSAEYKSAANRLGDMLKLSHEDPRFRDSVGLMSDKSLAEFAKATNDIYEKPDSGAPASNGGKGADVIPFPKRKVDSGFKRAADTDPEGLVAKLDVPDANPKVVLAPMEGIEKGISESNPSLAAKLKADRETVLKGDKESPEYKDALQRLVLLDAALRGPLDYGKGMKPSDLEGFVKPLYEDGPPSSIPPSGDVTKSFATGSGVVLGLLALFSPETARAAEGPLQQIQSSLHIGPVEALMVLGIGTLIGIPMVRKFWGGTKGPSAPPPASRDNPVRIEQDGKTTTIRPFEKRDLKAGGVIDGTIGTISKADSEVVGDSVHLTVEAFDPITGTKKATTMISVSKEEAGRLGIKLNKAGDEIAEVPRQEYLLQDVKTLPQPKLDLAADAAPKDKPVAIVQDGHGQETRIQDLGLFDPTKDSGALRSFGKPTSVEVSKDDPNKVTVRVDVFDPADPNADPTNLAFGIGKPEVVEQRSFTMSKEEAARFGLPLGEPGVPVTVSENKILLLNDKPSDIGSGNALYIPTSNEGGSLIYPAKMAGKKAIAGKIVTVDADRTSVLGDTVYVFFRGMDMPGKKGAAVGTEPIAMSLAEARKLGIALGQGGKLRVENNQFILSDVTRGKDKNVLVDGKAFEGDAAPVSVRLKVGDDGKIQLAGTDGKPLEAPKVDAGMVTGEGANALKIPTAVKVLGPTLAGLLLLADPSIAHASTLDKATSVFTDVLATGGVTMAVLAGLGVMIGLPIMISRSGAESGGPAPQANHPPLPVGDGKTYFQVMADSGGNPVVDQYMGPVTPPLLTFQRGPKGQWYSFEGNPPKQLHESMQDPALSRMWRPVKDGDLFQIGEKIIPFKAPAEAWIQYQMPDGTTTGYAPPAAPPASAPPAIAVSGKLAVGETRTVMPKADGSPFVIGRGQGDLQFTDSSVSGVHATIVRNQADGKWYLVDGPLGDPNKVSTNGIYTLGGRMPKYQAISDGQYFVINGATFQFRAPPEPVAAPKPVAPAPVVAAPVIPLTVTKVQNIDGVTAVVVSGKPYSVRSWTPGWTEMGTMILGRAVSASRVPNDPQGRVRVEVRTRRGAVGDPQEGAITMEMTPGEAADLKIPLRVDGTLDPSAKPPEFSFGEMGPPVALPRAADANPNPVVIRPPAPPPPPPAKGLVEAKDGAGNGYELEPASLGVRMDANKPMGTVLRLEPLPGNSGGKLFLVVEVRSNLRPDADVKTVSFSVTPEEAAKLGLKMDAKGKLAADSNLNLKVKMLEAPLPDIRPLVPGEVQGIWAENKPDAPRRGEVRKDKPTVEYGTAAGKTHEGIGYKDKNEDAVVQGPNWALVLDGMGGHMGGDKASQIASEATAKYLQTHLPSSDPKETLRQALIYGGDAVNATPYGKQGAGAVGVAHLVIKNPDGTYKAVIAHVGDAGAMVVGKDGKIKYRSKDQSLVQAMADSKGVVRDPNNETAELEMRVDPQANVVLGTIGAGHKASPVVEEIPLEPGDRIVMFSDGVSDGTSTKTLARMATEGKSAQEIQNAIFDSVLTKMADFEDAKNEGMKSGKRLPVTMMNGDTAYIDKRGDIYDSLKDGKLIDHYKADNMTVHVYVHEPASEGGSPGPKGGPDVLGKKAPPPLPAAAKKGTNTVVLKPGSDINYKVIPSENLITPSEMNGLEALNKRPHVAEILHDPNLKPVTKVKVGDQTFYLSRVIETVDEEGNVRPHVLALVPVQENGTTVLKRRFFYKSNSDGGWRASPYMLGGHYAKGVGKHYTQETQPIPELNEQFQILENAGSGVPKVRLKDEDFARYIDAGSPVLDQAAVGTMLGGFKKEIIFPANVGMTDIGGIQPGQAFKAGAYGGASDPAVIPRLANLRYPDGFIPDFKQAPSKTYQENHTLLKTITCREYQGGFLVEKGTGRKRPVIWTMAEDAQGRTWVKSIRYTDSKVNSYGVYDEVIDSGIITSKPLEYAQQSYKLPQQYRPDFDGQYVDITPALNMLKPIREYRQSRGMENPEIPKGMALVPPPPPPVVGPPRVLVSKPLPGFVINSGGANVELKSPVKGLSASQGKWVYQMPSDTSQAFLGRDAFLAQPGTDMVSTKHVRIFRADGTTFIEDSVSSNGTQVIRDGKVSWASRGKGDLMKSIFPLRPGDKIVMGGVEVLFNPS